MISPPNVTERVLESLGSYAEYRDAVLGDMAEEFGARAERDGHWSARWWYYGQAVRAVPALLRDSAGRAGARGVAYVLAAGMAAFYVDMTVLVLATGYVAAWIGRRSPLICAIGLSGIQAFYLVWLAAAALRAGNDILSPVVMVRSMLLWTPVAIAGALVRVLHTNRRADHFRPVSDASMSRMR
jgi:hypothetical protein